MSGIITIRLSKNQQHRANIDWDTDSPTLMLGRMKSESEERLKLINVSGEPRLAFADFRDSQYSRTHVRVKRIGPAKIEIQNTSVSPVKVAVSPDTLIGPEQSVERILPTAMRIGEFEIRFERSLNSLPRQTQFHRDFEPMDLEQSPIEFIGGGSVDVNIEDGLGDPAGLGVERFQDGIPVAFPTDAQMSIESYVAYPAFTHVGTLIAQLSTANSILQQATTKEDLYSKALAAVKSLIDMDAIAIVDPLNPLEIVSLGSISPSQSAIKEVCESRQVRWSAVDQSVDTIESQMGLEYFIGAPIVVPSEDSERVAAVLYAHRGVINSAATYIQRRPLTELHAQVFELIACSIAAGLVRIEHHATQGRFQQFFTPALARELMKSDELLKPCEREVTILFVDIRRFSSISERLRPAETSMWVQDAMTDLSDCVINTDGVLVDYIGDELMAMWGAPQDQPDHASRACKCALEMMERMVGFNEKWLDKIGEETKIGIGINTGMANVGNTGSKYKFKYGPLGDSVNRASRVQGLTKYLRVTTIISDETHSKLEPGFSTRRLGKAKVVNIDKTIELFELVSDDHWNDSGFANLYEDALKDLEEGNLKRAAAILKSSLNFDSPDHPTLLMMNEIIHRVINDTGKGDFEWGFDK